MNTKTIVEDATLQHEVHLRNIFEVRNEPFNNLKI